MISRNNMMEAEKKYYSQHYYQEFCHLKSQADPGNLEPLVITTISRKIHVYPQTPHWFRIRRVTLQVFPRWEGTLPWKWVNSHWMSPFLLGILAHLPFMGSPMDFLKCFLQEWEHISQLYQAEEI